MTRIVGIDPGAGGGVALLEGERLVSAHDMPVQRELLSSGRSRRRVDCLALARLLRELEPEEVAVEEVGARPGQGVVSMFSFGHAAGCVHGVVGALGLRPYLVAPHVWKRALRLPKGKAASRELAQQLWPEHEGLFSRARDDGRAEAALIGLTLARAKKQG